MHVCDGFVDSNISAWLIEVECLCIYERINEESV